MHAFSNALRRLLRRPLQAIFSVLVLGLGLGSVLFLLTLVNGLILTPLPFPHAERLMGLAYEKEGNIGLGVMSADDYQILRQELNSYELTAVHNESSVSLGQQAQPYKASWFSQSLTPLLGVTPVLGRSFNTADDQPGAALTVVLSERVWRHDFHADPEVLGRQITANGESATIIGVFPEGFAYPIDSQLWLARRLRTGDSADVAVVARLKPGISLQQAQAELAAAANTLGARLDGQKAGRKLVVKPLALRFVNENTRSFVWLMFAASAMVLLLACANCTNLQLTQILARRRELAIRSALGARQSSLLSDQLLECLLLSLSATLISLGVAQAGAHWISVLFTEYDKAPPYFLQLGIDSRLLLLALLTALLTTLLAGILPALGAAHTDPQEALRDGDKGSAGTGFNKIARILIVTEIALTVVLLVGAGIFLRGLERMAILQTGATTPPAEILLANIDLNGVQFPQAAQQVAMFERLVSRLQSDPQVIQASAANTVPGARLGSHEYVGAAGAGQPADGYPKIQMGIVDDNFGSAYGLSLRSGRMLDQRDRADTERVVVVSQTLADKLWPGRDPLGQRLILNPQREGNTTLTVIGVSTALQLDGPLEPALPSILVAQRQFPDDRIVLAIHTRGNPMAFANNLNAIIRTEHPALAPYQIRSQEHAISAQRLTILILTRIFSAVGILALLLAATGLYGILSFSVVQRTREMGVLRALGANNWRLSDAIGRRLLYQVLIGLGAGLLLALPWAVLLSKPSLHTAGNDPAIFISVIVLILIVAALACLIPLRRVLAIDPMIALRNDH